MSKSELEGPIKARLVIVGVEDEGQRLDNFLSKLLKGVPKSKLYSIVRTGQVRVNKKRAKPSDRLIMGHQVRVPPLRCTLPRARSGDISGDILYSHVAQKLQNSILFEDKDLLVINKPAGWAVHGGSGIKLGLIEALRELRPYCKSLELVHRLDRETSGCLLLAKKKSVLKHLHCMFRESSVQKYYKLLVQGHWPKRLFHVQQPLRKFVAANGERFVKVDPQGKPALTEFKVLQVFAETTFLRARLHTGRTHQIRVHAASVGCPVLGDVKYNTSTISAFASERASLLAGLMKNRHFLHCESITLTDCAQAQWETFHAPLDSVLETVLAASS